MWWYYKNTYTCISDLAEPDIYGMPVGGKQSLKNSSHNWNVRFFKWPHSLVDICNEPNNGVFSFDFPDCCFPFD